MYKYATTQWKTTGYCINMQQHSSGRRHAMYLPGIQVTYRRDNNAQAFV